MKPRLFARGLSSIASIALSCCLFAPSASAQSTWSGNTSNNWGTATNWSPAATPPAQADIIIADTTGSANLLVLDASREIGNFQFGTTGTRNTAFTVRSTSAHSLSFTGGLNATGPLNGVRLSFHGHHNIPNDQTWNVGGEIGSHSADRGVFIREIVEANGSSPAQPAGVGSLVMDGSLTKAGSGQLVIAAVAISGDGNFEVQEGALKLNAGANRLLTVGGAGSINLHNTAQLFVSRNSGTMAITRSIIANGTSGMVWGGGGTANDSEIASSIAWNGTTHTLNVPVANRYISSGAWTGNATVNRTGASTLTLNGNLSAFTGTLNLTGGINNILPSSGTFGGTLGVAAGTAQITGSIAGNLSLTGGTTTFPGQVGGSLALNAGATLSGEATATSALTLNGGTFSANPLTPGALSTAGNLHLGGPVSVSLAAVPPNTSPFPILTYGGSLTGDPANLSLLGGTANYRSPTFDTTTPGLITLAVGSDSRTWNSGGVWDINTSENWLEGDKRFFQLDQVLFTNTGAGTIALSGVLTPSSITVNASSDYTFTATAGNLIAGTTAITKAGSGILTLGGENTFSGPILVQAGTLRATQSAAFGANGNTFTVSPGATLDHNGAWGVNRDFNAIIAGNGSGAGAIINGSATSQQAGFRSITLAADASIGGTARFDVRPIIAGTGLVDLAGFTLTKAGVNQISLVEASITHGRILISEGMLSLTRNQWPAGTLEINPGGIARFENNNVGLYGYGMNIVLHSGEAQTTLNVIGADTIHSGTITGSGHLTKTGASALILTSDATHSGGTTISEGTLQIGNGGSSGSLAGNITNNANLTYNRGDNLTLPNTITGTGTLTKAGPGILSIDQPQTYLGNTIVQTGTLSLDGTGALPPTTNLTFPDAAGATFEMNGIPTSIRTLNGGGLIGGVVRNSSPSTATFSTTPIEADSATFSGVLEGPIRFRVLGTKAEPAFVAPRQRLAHPANLFTGGITVDGGTLMARTDGSLGAIPFSFEPAYILLQNNGTVLNEADNNSLTIHPNRGVTLGPGGGAFCGGFNNPLAVVVQSVISGAEGNPVTIIGNNGTVTFTAENTYLGNTILGPVTVNGTSRLSIGNGGATGKLGAGKVVNDGILTFNRSNTLDVPNDIEGSGSVNQLGPGRTNLLGNCTHAGATTIQNGTLAILGSLPNSPVTVATNATLAGNATLGGTVTVNGRVAPGEHSGTLTVNNMIDFRPGSQYVCSIGQWAGNTAGTDWNLIIAEDFYVNTTPETPLILRITGNPAGFSESNKSMEIARSGVAFQPEDLDQITLDSSAFAGTGTFSLTLANNNESLILEYTAGTAQGDAFAAWIDSFPSITDPLLKTPAADADADGLANAVEFLLDSNPANGTAQNLPTATRSPDGQHLIFTFTRSKSAHQAGFTASVEYSTTLASAAWLTATPEMITTLDNGATETVTATIPIPSGATRCFARLNVAIP
jgi:fibronectin-binding autotransporter adhesin